RNAGRDAARRPVTAPVSSLHELVAPESGADRRLARDETQRRLGAVLATLPEVQRSAVVLRHVVGLPTSEVAEVLRCAGGTAKSHTSRGLGMLRSLLPEVTTLTPDGSRHVLRRTRSGVDVTGRTRRARIGGDGATNFHRVARLAELSG